MTQPRTMQEVFAAAARDVSARTSISAAAVSSPERQQIATLKDAYNKAIESVRGDVSLSSRGKAQTIARVWSNARDEIDRLTRADYDNHVNRYNKVEASVFGTAASTPDSALSFRDAADRASRLDDPETAAGLLDSAELSGDAVLAKAVVMQSWQKGWRDVVDRYAVGHPDVTDSLAELGALRDHLESTASILGGSLAGSLSTPDEIRGLTNAQRVEYAEASPSPSAAAVFAGRTAGTMTPQQEADARAAGEI